MDYFLLFEFGSQKSHLTGPGRRYLVASIISCDSHATICLMMQSVVSGLAARTGKALRSLSIVHDATRLQRKWREDGSTPGLFATTALAEGTLLAMVPVTACISPLVAKLSPLGPVLDRTFSEGVSIPTSKIRFSSDVCLVDVTCALQLKTIGTPLHSYLRDCVQVPSFSVNDLSSSLNCSSLNNSLSSVQAHLLPHLPTDASRRRYVDIRGELDELLGRMHAQLGESMLTFLDETQTGRTPSRERQLAEAAASLTLEDLLTAHSICESRCVTVPYSETSLGGPALVPFIDLINHDFKEPNAAVFTVSEPEDVEELLQLSERTGLYGTGMLRDLQARQGSLPPAVVMVAATALAVDEELRFHYVEPHSSVATDPLFWAVRFGFVPDFSSLSCSRDHISTNEEPVVLSNHSNEDGYWW